jgi:hypothetical protein
MIVLLLDLLSQNPQTGKKEDFLNVKEVKLWKVK